VVLSIKFTIFIKLNNQAIINVPLKAFNNKDEQDIFIKFIESNLNKTSSVQM